MDCRGHCTLQSGRRTPVQFAGQLELSLLHGDANALYDGVVAVFGGVVGAFEVYAEEFAESLPEGGAE